MLQNQVTEFFAQNNFPLTPIFTGEDTSTVHSAAQVLGVEDGQIAKSLALQVGDSVVVLVTKGTARLDNQKFKAFFHTKAKMLSPEDTLAQTGYPVGGVCPFALPDSIAVYLDKSLQCYTEVYPAAGTRDSAVKVEVAHFSDYTGGQWIDVCKEPNTPQ